MFRRTDETDWSRFAKGGGREREEPSESPAAETPADQPATGASSPSGAPPRSPLADPTAVFSRPSPVPPPSPLVPATTDQIETVVGKGSAVQGTIRSEHSVRIQGTAQGEIESKRAVYVEEGARVSAKITAAEITISGQVDGQIFSSGRVEIKPSGQVTGEISAPTLVMHEGAFFDGQLKMKSRDQAAEPAPSERDLPPSAAGRRLPGAGGGGLGRGSQSSD
ncbi:MAG TPA: polymer-forming cytoskeletal protein [Chloroflexota bacterium]|nr:polymer-forming cytoskeletal protein [Chloroflexota bacterium]HZU05024.1 polymer-forming cytoskeletal protein [Chloroflexota bacterium]